MLGHVFYPTVTTRASWVAKASSIPWGWWAVYTAQPNLSNLQTCRDECTSWWLRNPASTSWYGKYPHDLQGLIHPNGGCLGFLNHQQYLEKLEILCCRKIEGSTGSTNGLIASLFKKNYLNLDSQLNRVHWLFFEVPFRTSFCEKKHEVIIHHSET